MRTTSKVLITAVVFLAVLVVALLVLQRPYGPDTAGGRSSGAIWSTGDSWTVTVQQDSAAITPDGGNSTYEVPYRFKVAEAPTKARDTWLVHVTQKGAQGPFAKGWYLQYRERDGSMQLVRFAVGNEPTADADAAGVVLGPMFPYELTYERAPRSRSVDGSTLMERTMALPDKLPPAPAGGEVGMAPPA